MRTPKDFSNNIKQNIITEDMLGACLYSVNKRAKNWRDYVRQLHSELDHVRMLYGAQGVEYQWNNIHRAECTRDQYYEYKDLLLSLVDPVAIHMESDTASDDSKRYYLFYRVGDFSFHRPLDKKDLDKYLELPQDDIGTLNTHGHEIQDLISVQFVMKVLDVIRRGQYTYLCAN